MTPCVCVAQAAQLLQLRVQTILQGIVDSAYTPASGLGVMPAFPILAVKFPRYAAQVVPDAPMQQLHQFYISNLSEKDLEPLVAVTRRERTHPAIEVCATPCTLLAC